MAEEKKPIIVKKIIKKGGGHHGGAWKIAYADFVTAMMAFFLLMWLLGSVSKGDLMGISEYFATPLQVAMQGGSGAGASNSILDGGGKDLTKKSGQVLEEGDDVQRNKKTQSQKRPTANTAALKRLQKKIKEAIDKDEKLKAMRNQLLLDMTEDGLRIQIVDAEKRPMFDVAKFDPKPYARDLLHLIGSTLNGLSNQIILSGHTDALPYPNGNKYYSNWELSSDRANASRRELVAGGMDDSKVLQVIGQSSALPLDQKDPLNPINRRISITVLNETAEARIRTCGKLTEASDEEGILKAVSSAGLTKPKEAKKE